MLEWYGARPVGSRRPVYHVPQTGEKDKLLLRKVRSVSHMYLLPKSSFNLAFSVAVVRFCSLISAFALRSTLMADASTLDEAGGVISSNWVGFQYFINLRIVSVLLHQTLEITHLICVSVSQRCCIFD